MQATSRGWKGRFGLFWSAQASSLFGSSLAQFALIWWLTERTGSATVLAIASIVGLLPMVFIGPFAGVLVDRWNRRRIMIVADGVAGLAALLLALLFFTDAIAVWHVYVALFVRAVAATFHQPASMSSTSLMVPREELSRVAGLNQTLQGMMQIAAPPLGALLLALMPVGGIMLIDVVTALIAIGLVGITPIPQPPRPEGESLTAVEASIRREMAEGLRYIWNWKGLLALMFIVVGLNFFLSPAFSLLPILVTQHFEAGVGQLAAMNSAVGIGMVAGGILLSVWGGFKRRIHTTMAGLVALALSTLLIGLIPASMPLAAVGMMALVGASMPITNGPVLAILQSVVPPAMQGRVMTVLNSAAVAAIPLGLLIAGPLAERFGATLWFVIGGVGCLAITAGTMLSKRVMAIEENNALPPFEGTVEAPVSAVPTVAAS